MAPRLIKIVKLGSLYFIVSLEILSARKFDLYLALRRGVNSPLVLEPHQCRDKLTCRDECHYTSHAMMRIILLRSLCFIVLVYVLSARKLDRDLALNRDAFYPLVSEAPQMP